MKNYKRLILVSLPLLIMFIGVPYFGSVPRLGPFPGLATWFLVWIVLCPVSVMIVNHYFPYDDEVQ